MKTNLRKLIAAGVILLGSYGMVIGQVSENTESDSHTIRIKMVKNINGVETIVDTTITASSLDDIHEMMDIEMDIDIEGLDSLHHDGEHVMIKTLDFKHESVSSCDSMIIKHHGDIDDPDVRKKLKEMGIDIDIDDDGNVRKHIIIIEDKDFERDGETHSHSFESEDGTMKMKVVIKKVDIQDLNSDDKKKFKSEARSALNDKLEVEEVNFYPNPNNGRFNLSFDLTDQGNTEVLIYNAEGKKVYEESLPDFSGTYKKEIDISKNASGLYYIRVTQGKKSWFKKMILK